ncbi:MAG: hypothetical protein LBE79_01555 [Tannerella sp.]|jgi:hypothetical protein|nr:hypothetical protein [Tannerella sp.]
MNAKNNKEVLKAIFQFSAYLLCSVALAVCMYASLMKASVMEMRQILAKSAVYDQLHMTQVILTERIDSIYHYSTLVDPDNLHINHPLMLNSLSLRSLRFQKSLENMNSDDCLIYKRLTTNMEDFFKLKDSIRTAELKLDVLRNEYTRCINNNRDMMRRLFNRNVY